VLAFSLYCTGYRMGFYISNVIVCKFEFRTTLLSLKEEAYFSTSSFNYCIWNLSALITLAKKFHIETAIPDTGLVFPFSGLS